LCYCPFRKDVFGLFCHNATPFVRRSMLRHGGRLTTWRNSGLIKSRRPAFGRYEANNKLVLKAVEHHRHPKQQPKNETTEDTQQKTNSHHKNSKKLVGKIDVFLRRKRRFSLRVLVENRLFSSKIDQNPHSKKNKTPPPNKRRIKLLATARTRDAVVRNYAVSDPSGAF